MPSITIAGFGSFNFDGSGPAIETDGSIESAGSVNNNFSADVKLVLSDASKELQEVDDLTAFIAGGSNINVTDDADGTITIAFSPPATDDVSFQHIVNADSPFTVGDHAVISANCTDGNIAIDLPTAVGIAGRRYTFKRTDASANDILIDGNGAETIDGASNYSLSSQYDTVTIVSDGANWLII